MNGTNDAIASSVVPVRKRSLHDQVADQVRDLIIEGHLEPGERIDEASLIDQLRVSRTPFREALRTLAAEGLVEIRPSRGTSVRKLASAQVLSMLEVLGELEQLGGRLAMERADDSAIKGLLDLHEQMMERYAARERLEYYKLNQRFHSLVTQLSNNETLVEVQSNIQARLKYIRFIGNRDEQKWAAAVADHQRMAQAIREKNGDSLGEQMRLHLMATWERVRDSL